MQGDISINRSTFDFWKTEKALISPQFKYWSIVLHLQNLLFSFLISIRSYNFQQYKDTLAQIIPWFFALDHYNYVRWLPIHLRDLTSLEKNHTDLYKEFSAGNFTAKMTRRNFSAIALDHAHEQMNAKIKGDGGAIGLTKNPDALRRWMLAGPHIAQQIEDFEIKNESKSLAHHLESLSSIQ
jgi:hypothetical protein